MRRKRSSVSSEETIEEIVRERRKYRVVDVFLGYEKIYEFGKVLRKRFNRYFDRVVFEALDTGRRRGKVLDLGTPFALCGINLAKQSGDFGITSLQEGKKVTEVSRKFSEDEMVEIKRVLGKPEELPFRDQSFDLVVSGFDMHRWGDPPKALREIKRVLKKRGRIVIYDLRRDRWRMACIPLLLYCWLVAGLWLFRRTRLAFKSSYTPKEIEKLTDCLELKGWEVEGKGCFVVLKN